MFEKYFRRMSAPLEVNIRSGTSQALNNWYYKIKLTHTEIDDIEEWWLTMMEAGKEVISLIRDSYARFQYAEAASYVNDRHLSLRDRNSIKLENGTTAMVNNKNNKNNEKKQNATGKKSHADPQINKSTELAVVRS